MCIYFQEKVSVLPFVSIPEAEKSVLETKTDFEADAETVLEKLNEPKPDQAALKPKVDKQCIAAGVGLVFLLCIITQ